MTIAQLLDELRAIAHVHGYGAPVKVQTMLNDDGELVAVRSANGSAVLDIEIIHDNADAL
jgi:hypothetical protein